MLRAHPEVVVDGLAGLAAEGARPRATSLANHDDHVLVEVEVLEAQVRRLRQSHPAVEKQADDCCVPSLLEASPLTGRQQPAEFVVTEDGYGHVRDMRRLHASHRRVSDLASVVTVKASDTLRMLSVERAVSRR